MCQEALEARWPLEALLLREDLPLPPGWEDLPCYAVAARDWKALSEQAQPEGQMAILRFPEPGFAQAKPLAALPPGPGFLLSEIMDPGNLGTIVRSADWFGFGWLICGPGCTDILSPKALRSTMGSFFRVELHYASDWEDLLRAGADRIWAADMEGQPAHAVQFQPDDVLLIGNEARGLPPGLPAGLRRLSIPRLGGAESLNAAMAASILAWQLRFG